MELNLPKNLSGKKIKMTIKVTTNSYSRLLSLEKLRLFTRLKIKKQKNAVLQKLRSIKLRKFKKFQLIASNKFYFWLLIYVNIVLILLNLIIINYFD